LSPRLLTAIQFTTSLPSLTIVTCQQFATLTGDDCILYKALRTYLADQLVQDDRLKDEGGKQSESSGVKEEDTKRKVRLEIVIWDDPSLDWCVYRFCILRSPWVRHYTASPFALKLTQYDAQDYTQKYDLFLDWLEKIQTQTQIFNDHHTIRWNSHKRYLIDLAENTDVAVVPPPSRSPPTTRSLTRKEIM